MRNFNRIIQEYNITKDIQPPITIFISLKRGLDLVDLFQFACG